MYDQLYTKIMQENLRNVVMHLGEAFIETPLNLCSCVCIDWSQTTCLLFSYDAGEWLYDVHHWIKLDM